MTILNSSQTEHIVCWSKWFMYCFVAVWIILRTSFRSLEYSKKLLYELSVLWAPHVPVARRDDARMSCFSPFSSSSSLPLDSIVAFMWKRLDHEHLRWAFVLLYFQSDYQYCQCQQILYLFCDALRSNYFILFRYNFNKWTWNCLCLQQIHIFSVGWNYAPFDHVRYLLLEV